MALLRKINTKAKTENNTGFGTNASDYGGRFVNKDGQPNVKKIGVPFLEQISWYHTLLAVPRWKFLTIIILFYFAINLIFALLYMLIGLEHLVGMQRGDALTEFGEAFFFSMQTFTTVGYGRISPSGFLVSFVASMEALTGLLSFALATGLLYGRFSKPTAYLKFSDNAIIAPYKNISALMIRLAPFKNTALTDAEAKISLGMMIEENGKMVNKFFPLELEFTKVNALTLSWTVVHPINEDSPLYHYTKEDIANTVGEVIVFIKAFDDMFSNTVVARTSYTFKEIIYGVKYVPMYHRSNDGGKTILDLEKLNTFLPAEIVSQASATANTAS
jgi:inward rectifier potassium channel